MSVALMIEKVDGEAWDKYVPVSTETFFGNDWMPLIQRMGLVWLDLMQPGLSITEEDLPEVLAELRQLHQQLPHYHAPEGDSFKYMDARLTTLIAELDALEGKKVELFIG